MVSTIFKDKIWTMKKCDSAVSSNIPMDEKCYVR